MIKQVTLGIIGNIIIYPSHCKTFLPLRKRLKILKVCVLFQAFPYIRESRPWLEIIVV